jgi:hypothetical protein
MSGEDTHESSTEAPSRALAEAGEPSAGAEADPASPEDTDRGSAPEGGAEESVETASQETSADEDDDGSTGETRPVA